MPYDCKLARATRKLMRAVSESTRIFTFSVLSSSLICLPACKTIAQSPMNLKESVLFAIKHNPDIRTAYFERDISRIMADREKPVARATITAIAAGTLQGSRVTFPRPDGKNAEVLPNEAARLDIIAELPLFRAGAMPARDRYRAQLSLAGIEYSRSVQNLIILVNKAYIDVLHAESGVRVAKDSSNSVLSYQELVRQQVRAGTAKPIDEETVNSQVAEAQAGLRRAENGLLLAKMSFNRSLGRSLETEIALAGVNSLPIIPDSPDAGVAAALINRPEIQILQQSLRIAQAGVSLAKSQSSPVFSARGQLTEQTPTAFLHEHYAAATIEMRWSILDDGKTLQNTREAMSQLGKLRSLIESTQQGIKLEVTQDWLKMRESRDRITLSETELHGAEMAGEVAKKAYEVGRVTIFDVRNALRDVNTAREHKLNAEYDFMSAAADFTNAQGNLLNSLGLSAALSEIRP